MKEPAKIIPIRERVIYQPPPDVLTHIEIAEAELDASKQRAREMVFSIVVFAFAFVGAAWMLGYIVGMVTR